MDIALIIGIFGTAVLVFTFILNEHHKLTVDDLTFDILHLIGSACLIIYSIDAEIYIFVILNSVAVFVSLNDIIKGLQGKPHARIKSALIRQKRDPEKPTIWQIFKKNKK